MMTLKNIIKSSCLLTAILFMQLNAEEKEREKTIPYQILRHADFKAITGCEIFGYRESMQAALNFLVFSEYHDGSEEKFRFSRDLLYTHRHSRQLFHDIAKNKKCQLANLIRMGKELQILDLEGNINHQVQELKENSSSIHLPDTEKYYINLKNDRPIFEVLSRRDYMDTTGCLVSPSSYHKYHLAVLYGALDTFEPEKAKEHLESFISDVAAGMHNDKGDIADKCLTNSIKILAEDLGLLGHR